MKTTSTIPGGLKVPTTINKKPIKTVVPTSSKAPRKDAYPTPGLNGQKGKIITTKLTTPENINPKQETKRRQQSVQGIEQLIIKYEQLLVLKEQYLQK